MPRYAQTTVAPLLLLLAAGCVSNPYNEFRGTIAHRSSIELASAPPKVYPTGAQWSAWVPETTQGLFACYIPSAGGSIVIIHRAPSTSPQQRQWRLTNDAILAVYFCAMDPKKLLEAVKRSDAYWREFLLLDPITRDRTDGVHRLTGKIDVERWNDILDFRIRLNMQSQRCDLLVVDGVLANYERWEFNPHKWLAMLLFQTGLFGEG